MNEIAKLDVVAADMEHFSNYLFAVEMFSFSRWNIFFCKLLRSGLVKTFHTVIK